MTTCHFQLLLPGLVRECGVQADQNRMRKSICSGKRCSLTAPEASLLLAHPPFRAPTTFNPTVTSDSCSPRSQSRPHFLLYRDNSLPTTEVLTGPWAYGLGDTGSDLYYLLTGTLGKLLSLSLSFLVCKMRPVIVTWQGVVWK